MGSANVSLVTRRYWSTTIRSAWTILRYPSTFLQPWMGWRNFQQRLPKVVEIPVAYGGEFGPDLEINCNTQQNI